MASTFRIPRASITGLYGRLLTAYARRTWGEVPDNAYVLWHHRPVLRAVLAFEGKVRRWNQLDPHLKVYAELAAAAAIGCTWCLDFGYFLAQHDGLDLTKMREVPRWRASAVFSELERAVLGYAEAMSSTPPTVTDAMVTGLVEQLGAAATVELTQVIGLENMRSRFSSAAGLQAQGFSDFCDLPPSRPQPAVGSAT